MFDAEVAEGVTGEWLRAVYGKSVAAQAMRLPEELRVQLYPEFTYGPAFREVQEFFDCARNPPKPSKFYRAASELWDKRLRLYRGDEVLRGRPVEDQFLYSVMQRQADQMGEALPEGMVEGFAVVALALSAEWLDQSSRDELALLTVQMNDLLAAVGLPALHSLGSPVVEAAR